MLKERIDNIIIAGPCAAQSREQVVTAARLLQERQVPIMRACLWKPRTKPGFEGVGETGIPWLAEAARMGITVATEVMLPDHVSAIAAGIQPSDGQYLLWLGSRNQHHLIQREIAARMRAETPAGTKLMIKNQPWYNPDHWLGIIDHVTDAGFPMEDIYLCNRGTTPSPAEPNPQGYRNVPNHDTAMSVREQTGLPMLLDPSHIGGSVTNVNRVIDEVLHGGYEYDGMIIEVSHDIPGAQSDQKQHLDFAGLDRQLQKIDYVP